MCTNVLENMFENYHSRYKTLLQYSLELHYKYVCQYAVKFYSINHTKMITTRNKSDPLSLHIHNEVKQTIINSHEKHHNLGTLTLNYT